jgi:hypothetical protein
MNAPVAPFSQHITNDHLLPSIQARSAQTKDETKEKTHVIEKPSTTRYTEKKDQGGKGMIEGFPLGIGIAAHPVRRMRWIHDEPYVE